MTEIVGAKTHQQQVGHLVAMKLKLVSDLELVKEIVKLRQCTYLLEK